MKRTYSSLIFLLLGLSTARAFPQLKPPPMGAQESGGAVASMDGKFRWKSHWTMERVSADGKSAIHFTETGEGKYSAFTENVHWKTESWWLNESVFRPLRFDKVFTDATGKSLVREIEEFDWKNHQAHFERRDLKAGKSAMVTIDIPDDTLSVEGIAAALRAVPFALGKSVPAHLLSNEPRLYDVTIEVRGRESCKTAPGSVDCYRLKVVPNVGVLNLFRFAFPKTQFWFNTDAVHSWMRYEGMEAGRGTPEIVMVPEEK